MARSRVKGSENTVLFASALLVAIGGLIYELILGTTASYLIGDSIVSFSLATGITLFGMGVGSLLVKYMHWRPSTSFAINEIALSFIGGNSVLILHLAFTFTKLHWVAFSLMSLLIGVLIGLEIPLLVKMFTAFGRKSSVELLSKVLAIDYFGALIASLAFPLLLLPQLGLMRSSYLVAALNIIVAVAILVQLGTSKKLIALSTAAALTLAGLFLGASYLERTIDAKAYRDPVLVYEQSAYQKIVLTKYRSDLRLFLNGQLQFSSLDEVRYHETMAASALTSVQNPRNVLVLGGGDGLLARELLKYRSVQRITIVDIDRKVTELAKSNRLLKGINKQSLSNDKVKIVNKDAFRFIFDTREKYDAVLVDLVDPSNEHMAKLYSKQFYRQVSAVLAPRGVMVAQATSSYFSPHAFHTVVNTVRAAQEGYRVFPFSHNIPSFGEWGFVLSTKAPGALLSQPLAPGTVYQSEKLLDFMIRVQPPAISATEASTLLEPKIIDAYNDDMRQWRYY